MENATVPELIYAVAHDMGEPVREIVGFAQLMAQRVPQDAGHEFWSHLGHIEAGALRTREMLNALADFLAVELEQPAVDEIDLGELLDDILTETMAVRSANPSRISGEFHGRIRTHPQVLRLILVELITNAARFGAADDGIAHISLALSVGGGMLEVQVADRGPGIDEGRRETALQLFQRLDRCTSHETIGAGLAIARRRAACCGGKLRLDTNGDCGLVATVALPTPVIDLRADAPEHGFEIAS